MYAQCHLEHDPLGIPLLVMERVRPLTATEAEDWSEMASLVDCGQIGKTADGRVVAYDFASG